MSITFEIPSYFTLSAKISGVVKGRYVEVVVVSSIVDLLNCPASLFCPVLGKL